MRITNVENQPLTYPFPPILNYIFVIDRHLNSKEVNREEALNWLKNASANLESISEKLLIEQLMNIKKVGVPLALLNQDEGHLIDRIRMHTNPGECFYHQDQLSHIKNPEIIKTISYGRVNYPQQPLFYGAVYSSKVELSRATAYFETSNNLRCKPLPDNFYEEFTLSRWKVKENIEIIEMVFSDDAIRNNPDVRVSFEQHTSWLESYEDKEFAKEYLQFISNEYARNDCHHKPFNYKISAIYFNMTMNLLQKMNKTVLGISYPSVQTNLEGNNIALLPIAAEKFLELEQVAVMCCKKNPQGNLIVDVLEVAEKESVRDNKFVWKS